MCQSPFDYCAPTVPQGGCPNCDFGARRGSMFHPTDGTPATTPVTPTLVSPDPTKASAVAPNDEATSVASTTTESAQEGTQSEADGHVTLTSAVEDAIAEDQ